MKTTSSPNDLVNNLNSKKPNFGTLPPPDANIVAKVPIGQVEESYYQKFQTNIQSGKKWIIPVLILGIAIFFIVKKLNK